MLSGMYSAATAVHAMEQRQQVIAHNLSHVNTPGFRGQSVSFATLLPASVSSHASAIRGQGTTIGQTATDFTPGEMIGTGRELDLAIDGDGFFVLQAGKETLYTRAGVFFVSDDGTLVAANGMQLEGENGPLQVPSNVSSDQIKILQDGTVFADQQQIGKVQIVTFADPKQLQRRGETMFVAPNVKPQPATARVIQGVREGANVNAANQLVQMISAMRHHEAALRALRSMSDTLQQHTRGNTA